MHRHQIDTSFARLQEARTHVPRALLLESVDRDESLTSNIPYAPRSTTRLGKKTARPSVLDTSFNSGT